MRTIRWRNLDPAEQGDNYRTSVTNWTKVHALQSLPHSSARWTRCGLEVPDAPYLEDVGDQIPADAPRCKRCARLLHVLSALIAVFSLGACESSSPTRPAPPPPDVGIPQSLTVEATPTTLPHTGGLVHLTGGITVAPGAILPRAISIQAPQGQYPSLVELYPDGHLDTNVGVTQAGEIIVTAGPFERRIAITFDDPPPGPPPSEPLPLPAPTPQPDPTPTPTPTPVPHYNVTLETVPLGVTLYVVGSSPTGVTFIARASAQDGAPPPWFYRWDWTGDGTTDYTTSTGTASFAFTTAGIVTPRVTVTGIDGSSGSATLRIAVTNAVRP